MTSNNLLYQKARSFDCLADVDIIKEDLQHKGYSHFSLPIELPPASPYMGDCDLSTIEPSVLSFLKLHILLGLFPVVYEGENNGNLIRHVTPMKQYKNQVGSQGALLDFHMHTDNPDLLIAPEHGDLSYSPDTLALLALRNDERIPTNIILLDDVLMRLSDKSRNLLLEPQFSIKRPESFSGQNKMTYNLPVLIPYNHTYKCRFDSHNVFGQTKAHAVALDEFRKIANDPTLFQSFHLSSGEGIIFQNHRVLHARKAFQPKFDGKDRWLLRIFGLYKKPDISLCVTIDDNHHLRTA